DQRTDALFIELLGTASNLLGFQGRDGHGNPPGAILPDLCRVVHYLQSSEADARTPAPGRGVRVVKYVPAPSQALTPRSLKEAPAAAANLPPSALAYGRRTLHMLDT